MQAATENYYACYVSAESAFKILGPHRHEHKSKANRKETKWKKNLENRRKQKNIVNVLPHEQSHSVLKCLDDNSILVIPFIHIYRDTNTHTHTYTLYIVKHWFSVGTNGKTVSSRSSFAEEPISTLVPWASVLLPLMLWLWIAAPFMWNTFIYLQKYDNFVLLLPLLKLSCVSFLLVQLRR